MRVFGLFTALAFLTATQSSCAHGAQHELPRDVAKFIENRDLCDHFRGELPDPSETERLKEVIESANKYCGGTDRQLLKLKKKHENDPKVMAKLNAFETPIEKTP